MHQIIWNRGHRLNTLSFFSVFFMSRIVSLRILNVFLKFTCQTLIELQAIYRFINSLFVNKARVFLLFTDVLNWYKFDAFFCWLYYLWTHWIYLFFFARSYFVKQIVIPYFPFSINKYKTRFVYLTMNCYHCVFL